jgi:hypothetical protein
VKGDKGDFGSKGDKGDKGAPAFDPLSSTDQTAGNVVISIVSESGIPSDNVQLVRTGNANDFKLEIPTHPSLVGTYAAIWSNVGESATVTTTANGSINVSTSKTFSLGNAVQFSIMVKISNKWAKIDLFRENDTQTKWYGFSHSN